MATKTDTVMYRLTVSSIHGVMHLGDYTDRNWALDVKDRIEQQSPDLYGQQGSHLLTVEVIR